MSSKIGKLSELENVLCHNESLHKGVLKPISAFKIGGFLGLFESAKKRGWRVSILIVSLLLFRLKGESTFAAHKNTSFLPRIDDNTFYRLMNNCIMNWRGLLYRFAKEFKRNVEAKGDPASGPKCFVIDDTDLNKTGKTFEFMGRVFNHVTKKYLLGFKLLLLGYWDGKSLVSADFSLHHEKGSKGTYGISKKEAEKRFTKKRDAKSNGAKRVKELGIAKTQNCLSMIRRAIRHGFIADYVLMDSWFVNDTIIAGIKSIRNSCLHVLGMCKMDKRKYSIDGKELNARELIARYARKRSHYSRKHKSQYISLIVDYKGNRVRLYFIKYRNSKNWTLLLTTDLTLSFVQTLELYQIRWTIEVLFKECKQYLGLGQSQNTDFDGQIADATLALITHTILTLNKRFEDYETTGAIYRQVQQDMLELTLYERLLRILAKVVLVLAEMFGIDVNEAMEKMITNENIPQQLINVVMELDKTRDNQMKTSELDSIAA
jgi:hypothetical protein